MTMKKSIVSFISLLSLTAIFLPLTAMAQASYPKVDKRGNKIPDYSYCGYKASDELIPEVAVKAFVPYRSGDATAYIQAAIDYVSSLPVDENGFRGAVQLDKGQFQIEGGLLLSASGVVLRGSGSDENGTELLGLGQDRTTMIRLAGRADRRLDKVRTLSAPVAMGDMFIRVNEVETYSPGQTLLISRWVTQEWVNAMDMNDFGGESSYIGWKPGDKTKGRPGDVEVRWERQVLALRGDTLFLDAPLTCDISLEEGMVQVQTWPGRIAQVAVENLRLTSVYDESNPYDENHRWNAIELDNAEDAWVRRVQFRHFAGSAVFVTDNVRRVTVEDCQSYAPVSEIGGSRRYTFHTLGGQCLFQRLYAQQGFHDFSTGHIASGPNAFVQCQADWSHHMSGAIAAWSTGLLFDNFNGVGVLLSYGNRGQDNMGAGWTAANSMMWNCSAAMLANPNPPTAHNWAYGAWGQMQGRFESADSFVKPQSLFYAQLAARNAATKDEVSKLMPIDTQSASNPPINKAQVFVAEARQPALELKDWIDSLQVKYPLTLASQTKENTLWLKSYKQVAKKNTKKSASLAVIENGIITKDDAILTGTKNGIVWWNGSTKARYLFNSKAPHITRWVPGRTGTGFTDDLEELTNNMKARGVLTMDHHYGLWYDRRRDDHERIRRMDGYVWAPFYEQPFARSGQGVAYDGLSKYDLTKWNVWYWNRLKTYADLADEKGLMLYHQHFFQHNIIEAGAHWADSPWRSANNINDMGFPEPVPYAVDKRVYMSEHFYDVSHEGRRAMYRNYIRKSLDEFADNGSVIHFISEEYTGPLHFVQFWLDVIAEWEAETGKDAKVALSCTKDVQDAILADEVRAKTVDIIDMKYWHPTMNGFHAPPGGVHMAPRQYGRLRRDYTEKAEVKARNASERTYEVVSDYRQRFPEKAFIVSANGDVWAAMMGGASLCALPSALPQDFKKAVPQMRPVENKEAMQIGKPGLGYVVYAPSAEQLSLNLEGDGRTYHAKWINPRNGLPVGEAFKMKGGKTYSFEKKGILWLYR